MMVMPLILIGLAVAVWVWAVCRFWSMTRGRPVGKRSRLPIIRFRCSFCGRRKTFLRASRAAEWMLEHYAYTGCSVTL